MLINKKTKQLTLRVFFTCQIIAFAINYVAGSRGLQYIWTIADANKTLRQNIAQEKREVQELDAKIAAWKSDPFYHEKMAREELQLAKKGEEIYILD